MNITFENISNNQAIKLGINNTSYIIEPETSVEIVTSDGRAVFITELLPVDFTDAFGEDFKPKKLKERFLFKASKKFTEKIPDMTLNTAVTYELNSNYSNVIIELSEAGYSVADGYIADIFDMSPIGYGFPRAESTFGNLKVKDTHTTNRKRFLRLYRTAQLFIDYFFFIEIYALAKYYSSDKYVKRLITKLYSVSSAERTEIFNDKLLHLDGVISEKHSHRIGFIKIAIVLLALGGLIYWSMTSEPDVIISNDFQQIVCFDEVFVLYDGDMPADAKDVFLEDYTADYQSIDGEYEYTDNYYCIIYEDSDGERYLWLKEDWDDIDNRDKDYTQYSNPKIYKSIGEQE